jgi:1,4-alpha-glucan branching enzyme
MKREGDGSFTLEKTLPPGRYAYKFVVDGTNWKEDPKAAEFADDGFGGKNSVVVVGGAAASPVTLPAKLKPATAGAGPSETTEGVRFVWTGGGNTVNIAGEFNSWSTSADPLSKQADGSFALVKALAPGRYAYKFVIDGGTWKEDPSAKETADDGFGGKNSLVVVTGIAGSAPAPAPTAPAPAQAAPVTSGAGTKFTWTGGGNTVNLAGEFNSWSTSADPLAKQADGSFTVVKALAPGRYTYKFVIDGGTWKEDPSASETVDDGYGGKNSVVVVAGSGASAPPGAAPAASPPAVIGKAVPPAITPEGVRFTFAGPATTVALAGEFNAWSTTTDPMTRQSDGTWTILKKLAKGAYAYKFLVDGRAWKTDSANPESKDDGFGGTNSIVTVP